MTKLCKYFYFYFFMNKNNNKNRKQDMVPTHFILLEKKKTQEERDGMKMSPFQL